MAQITLPEGINPSRVRPWLTRMREEIVAQQKELAEDLKTVDALERAICGVRGGSHDVDAACTEQFAPKPPAAPVSHAFLPPPRTVSERVQEFIRTHRRFRTEDVVNALQREKPDTVLKTIESTLARLTHRGQCERLGRGWYESLTYQGGSEEIESLDELEEICMSSNGVPSRGWENENLLSRAE